jgi:CubicO group peptidase (beta-lactamase class C family)
MEQQGVPGVAIALVRDGRVVWAEGFGVTNVLTGKPVTPDSTFKVASNSKVVTAYIALRLVDQGMLALDEPPNGYLSEPFLPQEEYRLKSSSPMCAILQRHMKSGRSSPSTVSEQNVVSCRRFL